jgi:transcriptional regulator with XRE-family HTH domain
MGDTLRDRIPLEVMRMAGRSKTGDDDNKGLPPFAVKLKTLREAAGLTQDQLAQKAGLHLGAIFKLEQGKRQPSWETVQTLTNALGVTCLEFTGTVDADQVEEPKNKAKKDTKKRKGK